MVEGAVRPSNAHYANAVDDHFSIILSLELMKALGFDNKSPKLLRTMQVVESGRESTRRQIHIHEQHSSLE